MEVEGIIARSLQVLIALGGAYLVASWFVLIVWTYRDIEARSKNVVTQVFSTLLAVFFWVPGVLLYTLLRPKETLDEVYQKSLEEEYLLQDLQEVPLCPNCNHFISDEWQICPHCNTQLREGCHNCGRLVDLRWDLCPYCGVEQHEHPPHAHAELQPAMQPTVQLSSEAKRVGWVDPAEIESRLKAEAAARQQGQALPGAHVAKPLVTEEVAAVSSQSTQSDNSDEN